KLKPEFQNWNSGQAAARARWSILPGSSFVRALSQRERQLDADKDRHRLTEPRARLEFPLARSVDGLLVQTKRWIERADNLNIADRSIRVDDTLEQHRPLNLRPHRGRRFVRTWLNHRRRQRN